MTAKTLLLRSTALLLILLSACAMQQTTRAPHNIVLLVSVDGLRADRVGSGAMPTLDRLAADGVHAAWMNPSYPTQTFPNHYTIVTGLRPDHHGIIDNRMSDPELGHFDMGWNDARERDPRWWGGEPIWLGVQKHGGRSATMFWPGSDIAINGQLPDAWRAFDYEVTPEERVDQVLDWLDQPDAERPQLITLYFEQVDVAGHRNGPNSESYAEAMRTVDAALARLLTGIDQLGLRDQINLIIVSDHGMAEITPGHRLYLQDVLARNQLSIDDIAESQMGQFVQLRPRPERADAVARALIGRHPHFTCWDKQSLPARWHFGSHPRVPPIICQVDVGWQLLATPSTEWPDTVRGSHGYAPESPDMRAVFVANGPDLASGVTLQPFDNVDVYLLMTRLLGIPAQPNDGSASMWEPVLNAGRAHHR